MHFGNNVKYKIVGMKTRDIFEYNGIKKEVSDDYNIDIVYHGAIIHAKGVEYVLFSI